MGGEFSDAENVHVYRDFHLIKVCVYLTIQRSSYIKILSAESHNASDNYKWFNTSLAIIFIMTNISERKEFFCVFSFKNCDYVYFWQIVTEVVIIIVYVL